MNQKYYSDIKNFPTQFAKGFELAKDLKVPGEFNRIILGGMGGSSFFVELMNDYLATDASVKLKLQAVKSYNIPKNADANVLFLASSYSGNTEESLEFFDQIIAKGFKCIAICSGGKLEQKAIEQGVPVLKIPGGIQPRLSTGYFIAGIFKVLMNMNIIPDKTEEILAAANTIEASLNEEQSKEIALAIKGKVPVIYATENNASLAQITKIKFNENSKTQAFSNFFPELNHNEMVGFTNLVMSPYFLIFQSQYTHPRNIKRIEIFKKILTEKGAPVEVIKLKGTNILEEILMGYYLADHITYYLADAYGIDPEPVAMVEDFKKMLVS